MFIPGCCSVSLLPLGTISKREKRAKTRGESTAHNPLPPNPKLANKLSQSPASQPASQKQIPLLTLLIKWDPYHHLQPQQFQSLCLPDIHNRGSSSIQSSSLCHRRTSADIIYWPYLGCTRCKCHNTYHISITIICCLKAQARRQKMCILSIPLEGLVSQWKHPHFKR